MSQPLLFASRSQGKLREVRSLLVNTPYTIVSVSDIASIPEGYEPEETAHTFEGNALIKAFLYGQRARTLVLAEDAGLEIDALGGAPGVLSARYGQGTDEDRCKKVLEEMKNVVAEDRTARFKTVAVVYDPKTERIRSVSGEYEGLITTEMRGKNGFGYDPIFYSIETQKTGAEMTQEEKNMVSHRARAMKAMREILLAEFQEKN